MKLLDRYEVNPETECWEWTGAKHVAGYGICHRDGRRQMAHRVLYEHHVGSIPPKHDLHHVCRNKGCVNPAHLEPLTRRAHMVHNPHTKLTPQEAEEIRVSMQALCERYGVRPRTLAAIAEGTIWNG